MGEISPFPYLSASHYHLPIFGRSESAFIPSFEFEPSFLCTIIVCMITVMRARLAHFFGGAAARMRCGNSQKDGRGGRDIVGRERGISDRGPRRGRMEAGWEGNLLNRGNFFQTGYVSGGGIISRFSCKYARLSPAEWSLTTSHCRDLTFERHGYVDREQYIQLQL